MKTQNLAKRRERFLWRWNLMEPKQRRAFYDRWAAKLDCLLEKIGLTGWCTACCALVDPREHSHRDACPECGRHEIVTPYGG